MTNKLTPSEEQALNILARVFAGTGTESERAEVCRKVAQLAAGDKVEPERELITADDIVPGAVFQAVQARVTVVAIVGKNYFGFIEQNGCFVHDLSTADELAKIANREGWTK